MVKIFPDRPQSENIWVPLPGRASFETDALGGQWTARFAGVRIVPIRSTWPEQSASKLLQPSPVVFTAANWDNSHSGSPEKHHTFDSSDRSHYSFAKL